tara:strand:- start:5860 stop:6876 length:1017 start_codon:yes stop_codon:yes gene_type:complete
MSIKAFTPIKFFKKTEDDFAKSDTKSYNEQKKRQQFRKASSLDSQIQKQIDAGVPDGFFCTRVREPVPRFRRSQSEKVYEGYNNSFIVLGRDRHSNLGSGCGGAGYTSSGMIDLVVGRLALSSAEEMGKKNPPIGKEEEANPCFITDAARIYITQKCNNIDEYFGFANTKTSDTALRLKSAIAMKADHVRIIGRQTVRFYCGGVQNAEGLKDNRETNSIGEPLTPGKIEFVVENEKHLQPAVLGDNLKKYLVDIEEAISELQSDVNKLCENLLAINGTLAIITQGASPFSTNVKSNIEGYMQNVMNMLNGELRKIQSLDEADIIRGSRSILSNRVFIC